MSPTDFENLVYDCLSAVGMKNLVWRTPGADGGRDIEGIEYIKDLSGQDTARKWFIECKRYSSSIDWPTVWKKIAYADGHGADFLMVATNSNPSPSCENEITRWNDSRRYPKVRFWRGYDLPRLIRSHQSIASAYGLVDNPALLQASALPLTLLISSINQAMYVSHLFGADITIGLEASACLSELLSHRLSDLERHGRFVSGPRVSSALTFGWLRSAGEMDSFEEVGLRAMLTTLRHLTQAPSMEVHSTAGSAEVHLNSPRFELTEKATEHLRLLSVWAQIELNSKEPGSPGYALRQR